jgi:hypothetical protein
VIANRTGKREGHPSPLSSKGKTVACRLLDVCKEIELVY